MSSLRNHGAKLKSLLAAGSVPRSACGPAFLDFIAPLLATGVLAEERARGGRNLVVCEAAALGEFIQLHFPDAPIAEDAPAHGAGVAPYRDAQEYASDTPEIVHLRAWRDEALALDGAPAGAPAATVMHGVFSFLLGRTRSAAYTLRGDCALVENLAVFANFEQLGMQAGGVVYGPGRASQRLLDWLAAQAAPDFGLIYVPDYDPVGLEEFERLRAQLGPRVRLHLPKNLAARFAAFSNRALLDKERTRATLDRLRGSDAAEVRQVVALIDRHNAGLEQAALLLPLAS